ncbi:hypothetical protein K469DRAFT_653063 [Zopfia rhizophila CBS 207.26]|uniref:Xylanolytic transcriptional activator regulatory domain-containing protein n=1 Tax=Zopfia rhizophila CBS 207.26 TaxID=1314779 RepID=A0A6A6ELX1_9PEZI|nr:hypothetical protein K469DRAFT_653063 [Zopfia rhizophila CBS 207.26]
MSAKVLGPTTFWSEQSAESALKELIKSTKVEYEMPGDPQALDSFRAACLLAFYGFHQYPGQGAWMRISLLTRKAYHCGLHQIDSVDELSMFDPKSMGHDEIEDWRQVWWCIYCLDSYSNFSTGTPYMVELESLNTSLPKLSAASPWNRSLGQPHPVFLPTDLGRLWETTQSIVKNGGEYNFSIHLVATTILKKAVGIRLLQKQNPSPYLQHRLSVLEDHLSAIRLSLPPKFLNEARNVTSNETSAGYNNRLVSLLKFHAARLLIYLPTDMQSNEGEWRSRWQQNFECCSNLVSIFRQWDTSSLFAVDPAVCFMAFATLLLLHLHSLYHWDLGQQFRDQVARHKGLVKLFLGQFANFWRLPQFLLVCFDRITESMSTPLVPEQIDKLLGRFQSPLHPKVLSSLNLSQSQYGSLETKPAPSIESLAADPLDILVGMGHAPELNGWMGFEKL